MKLQIPNSITPQYKTEPLSVFLLSYFYISQCEQQIKKDYNNFLILPKTPINSTVRCLRSFDGSLGSYLSFVYSDDEINRDEMSWNGMV